jgi:surfactin synthase thioesterase subunit
MDMSILAAMDAAYADDNSCGGGGNNATNNALDDVVTNNTTNNSHDDDDDDAPASDATTSANAATTTLDAAKAADFIKQNTTPIDVAAMQRWFPAWKPPPPFSTALSSSLSSSKPSVRVLCFPNAGSAQSIYTGKRVDDDDSSSDDDDDNNSSNSNNDNNGERRTKDAGARVKVRRRRRRDNALVRWASLCNAEVLAVEPPGRETRRNERAFTSLREYAEQLVDVVGPHLTQRYNTDAGDDSNDESDGSGGGGGGGGVCVPFVIVAHSVGTWAAFEFAMAMRRKYAPTTLPTTTATTTTTPASSTTPTTKTTTPTTEATTTVMTASVAASLRVAAVAPSHVCISAFPPPCIAFAERPWQQNKRLDDAAFKEECKEWSVNDVGKCHIDVLFFVLFCNSLHVAEQVSRRRCIQRRVQRVDRQRRR